jgi:deazaflavin-dependent oxidoreductase (nitroreductase family)
MTPSFALGPDRTASAVDPHSQEAIVADTSRGTTEHGRKLSRTPACRNVDPEHRAARGGDVAEVDDWNRSIIEEFRANEGRVGGRFEGRPLLLLHSFGARTGEERVNPLAYATEDDRLFVFASKGGSPTNPDWYYNLLKNPRAIVEVGTETYPVDATELHGEERARIWQRQITLIPAFGEYERRSGRRIPVFALRRVDDEDGASTPA